MRAAERLLAGATLIEAGARRHNRALIKGWLVAHTQLNGAAHGTEATEAAAVTASPGSSRLSPADLRERLERFKAELRASRLRDSTIHA